MNRLQADGLLKREAPLRGRVGQPTIPMSLDPEGAYSLGLKIGRRSCDLVLIDFRGAVRRRAHRTFAYPTPAMILDFVRSSLPAARRCAERSAKAADRRPRRRLAVPTVELGGGNRRAARRHGPPGETSTPQRKSPTSAPIRSRSATTRPPPARPNSSSAEAGDIAISFISSSAPSSAAGWCSTERCAPGAPATPARSDRCRSWPRAKAAIAPQLIACASIYQLERRLERAGIDAVVDVGDARRVGGLRTSSRRLDRGRGFGSGLCLGRGDLGHRFRGDRHRRRDACERARSC